MDGKTTSVARRADTAVVALFGVVVYAQLLLTAPGRVVADTKSYLYLDPARVVSRAVSMWDPHIGLGTTTHQNIGYAFPMGPFFWVAEHILRLPPWAAQRLWLGTLILVAGLGMRALMRTFGLTGPGVYVSMFAYALTPYALEYSSRLSALICPWAALPWLMVFTVRAMTSPRWREAALIALTIQIAGSVNASSLIFVLIGPATFVLWALVLRDVRLRTIGIFAARTVLLVGLTSLWWLSGLWVEGRYGLNILKYTETLKDVSRTLYPYEVLRGLGYWMFYGRDPGGFWNDASLLFASNPFVVAVSLFVPAAAFVGSGLLRWRYKTFFAVLILVGIVVAIGAAPYANPSIAGGLFKSFAGDTSLGLALRSTARATPLIALGIAALLGAAVSAWHSRKRTSRRQARGIVLVAVTLCVVNAVGLWRGVYYSRYLQRGEVPEYWQSALAALDAKPHDTRVLSIPGADFAAYSWGNTIDPIEPGLMDRPFVARELVPWGSAPGANLLTAIDTSVQDGTAEPRALAEVARLMNVGDVIVRLDMDSSRYSLAPASQMWATASGAVGQGLSEPTVFGSRDAVEGLGQPTGAPSESLGTRGPIPAIAAFPVTDPIPIVRTSAGRPVILVSGDGQGFVDLASAGLLDSQRIYLSSGALAHATDVTQGIGDDGVVVVTDTNRRRSERSLRHRFGYTEVKGEVPLIPDLHDQRLDTFPGASDASRTVAVLEGVRAIRATAYGSQFGYTPENRAAAAFDGNPATAWTVSVQEPDRRLRVDLEQPITTNRIGVAMVPAPDGRSVGSVDLRFDGGPWITRRLQTRKVGGLGQFLTFQHRTFHSLELRIRDIAVPANAPAVSPASLVGFSEIAISNDAAGAKPVRITETMHLPTDALDALGATSATHPLVYLMTRESTMDRFDMRRSFTVASGRRFAVSGDVTLSGRASDAAFDKALGIADAEHGGLTVTSSRSLTTMAERASNAVDDDPATAWVSPFDASSRPVLRLAFAGEQSVDSMQLRVVNDGRHAIPTQLRIRGGGADRTVDVPANANSDGVFAVAFAPLRTRELTIEVTKVAPVPVGTFPIIALSELGLPGIHRPGIPATFPQTCTNGFLSIDGNDLRVRLSGNTADAIAGKPTAFVPCNAQPSVQLDGGPHLLVASNPPLPTTSSSPWVLRRAALASDARGRPLGAAEILRTNNAAELPKLSVDRDGSTVMKVRLPATATPYWLVLGQSYNRGWHAKLGGRDLGPSTLVGGFANGWRIDPAGVGQPVDIVLEWQPQKVVDVALWVSLAAVLLCVGIAVIGRRSGRDRNARSSGSEPQAAPLFTSELGRLPNRARNVVPMQIGVAAAVFVHPWVGAFVALVTFAAARDDRVRRSIRVVPALIVMSVGLVMGVYQVVAPKPPGIDWALAFSALTIPTWVAMFLFVADSLLDPRTAEVASGELVDSP